jgi:hypothetical protein
MKKNEEMIIKLAKIETDIEWIKESVKEGFIITHEKQDKTNGRINALEQKSERFVGKDTCASLHKALTEASEGLQIARLDFKGKILVAVLGFAGTTFAILLAFIAAYFFKVKI